MPLLEVKGARKQYGKLTALDGVNLSVESGQFHGLIGPNGSGKSTLLKCIAGAESADSGHIAFLSRDITRMTPTDRARSGIRLKFQITSIFPELTVYDNLLLAIQAASSMMALMRSASRHGMHALVLESLERFRLTPRMNDAAGILSHGEQQWLEIAMALSLEPKLLLLDEPTAGMSPEERRVTGELLTSARHRCAMLIVEHDLDFIKGICEVLTVLDQGQVLEHGTVAQVEASERVQEVYLTRV
jgi:urea transport system ATP-binding protein